jgi:hypothetical protein
MALRCEVVDLIWPHCLHEAIEASRVSHIAIVENETRAFRLAWMCMLKVVYAPSIH